ncbi:MAG TPA: hypothetical protein VF435_13735 [Pyrinomonadaceae bacterium]
MPAQTAPASNHQNWNPPGKIFDDFEVTHNTAPSPTVTTHSPTSGATGGGASVTLTVSIGTSATDLTVVGSMKGLVTIV